MALTGHSDIALYISENGSFAAFPTKAAELPWAQWKMWSVFILYENVLFARGLERLLRQEGVKVVGSAMRVRQVIERIRKADPDVVIAEVESEKSEAEALLARLMRGHSRAAVVRMSLENNSATLYTGHRWTANTAEDLVREVLNSVSGAKGGHKHASA